MRAGIALGANLGDRLASLKTARERVSNLPGVQGPILASSVYETEPVNCEATAGRFLNAVVEIEYTGDAAGLLRELRNIEAALGRPSAHARNTSRTLDLDLLYFGDVTISRPELQLPHPRMQDRRFVLEPLAQIRPDLVLPGQTRDIATVLQQLPDRSPLLRVASEW